MHTGTKLSGENSQIDKLIAILDSSSQRLEKVSEAAQLSAKEAADRALDQKHHHASPPTVS